jgi:hypothetical protein
MPAAKKITACSILCGKPVTNRNGAGTTVIATMAITKIQARTRILVNAASLTRRLERTCRVSGKSLADRHDQAGCTLTTRRCVACVGYLVKQVFWWFSEGRLLRDARAVLLTTKTGKPTPKVSGGSR